MNTLIKTFYKSIWANKYLFVLLGLSACAYKQDVAVVKNQLNFQSYKNMNIQGNKNVSLVKNGAFAGEALIVGYTCSAHTYPYDFSESANLAIEGTLNKIYANSELTISSKDMASSNPNDLVIELKPEYVRVMCHAASQVVGECVGITKLAGQISTQNKNYTFEVEKRVPYESGGFCGGGSVALANSIGGALNEFSDEVYDYLTASD